MKSPRPARWLVALLGIGGVLLAMSALAQDCPELVGRVHGGTARALAVAGDLAFLAGGHELLIADVSDPLTPRVVGDVWITAQDVAVSGDYAYVASGGLAVIDVSTPSAPVEVGFYDLPDYDYPIDVAVSDGYAYIVTNTARLRVIDVSVPSAPVEVGFIDTPDFTNGVAVSGGYAYVADWGEGLRVIDVSTPSAPVEVGFVGTQGAAWGVAVDGSYVYVGRWFNACVLAMPVIFVVIFGWWVWQAATWYPDTWWNPLKTLSPGTMVAQWTILLTALVLANNWLAKRVRAPYPAAAGAGDIPHVISNP